MMKRIFLQTVSFFMLAALAATAQERKIISPPEFQNQGKDEIPFSPGVLVGDTLYVSGEIGFDRSGQIPKDFEAEAKACLDNIGIILKAAGMDYSDVVSAQVYLTDISLFKRMNAVYSSVFKVPRPARVTVGVSALAVPTAHIEIMVTARRLTAK
jgi:2-iminobutanoate/2-iminopropanoate deaminase